MQLSAFKQPVGPGLAIPRKPLQRRSIDAVQRLFAAARELVAARDFDTISIQELAAAGGCSIGSFYYRFGTKESFFDLLLDDMILKRRNAVRETLAAEPVERLAGALARGALVTHQVNAGLLRSAIKKQLAGEGKWQRLSEMGKSIAADFIHAVEEKGGRTLADHQKEQVFFSFVWLYGLLTQSVLGLNTMLGVEAGFFEREAVTAFEQAIAKALD